MIFVFSLENELIKFKNGLCFKNYILSILIFILLNQAFFCLLFACQKNQHYLTVVNKFE